jgi:hypothetical protein
MADRQVKFLLTIIAVALCGLVLQNELRPQPVSASVPAASERTGPAIGCMESYGGCIAVDNHKAYYIHMGNNGFKVDGIGELK